MGVSMCLNIVAHGGWKKVSVLLVLELQVVMSHLMWVLGTELRSSVRTVYIFNC